MGDLLQFPLERAQRTRPADAPAPVFFFDVASPLSYLTAERVERSLGEVDWVAVDGSAIAPRPRAGEVARIRTRAEAQARALRLPLIWPDKFPERAPGALRAAAFACELGAGPAFALAASRLAFCGGFALDDPETLAEAAAAAAVPLGACLEAARESWRDEELRETARSLHDAGVSELPAFRIAGRWLQGEDGLSAATALVAQAGPVRRPLAPVG
jgi:2-hydroxychromene-2-carboxylate isomerase